MKYNKKEYLNAQTNKTFCILPWIHSYIHTTGEVRLCCLSPPAIGQLDENNSWEQIWNNDEYKKIRLAMLNNQPLNPYCYQCYDIDKLQSDGSNSLRVGSNYLYGDKHFDTIVAATNPDGSLNSMNIKYVDIRWNNICNFKCRMCTSDFSSLIAAENLEFTGNTKVRSGSNELVVSVTAKRPNFINEILPYLDDIECIYFAGGEPLVTKEHYKILEHFIAKGQTNIRLNYSTNLSKLTYDGHDVVELWKHFSNISVSPSLDSWGARAEYLRTGTNWPKVENNLRRVLEECPHVEIIISSVVSAFNILTFANFLDYMIRTFKFDENTVQFNSFILDYPKEMNVDLLPVELRKLALTKIQQLKDKYPTYNGLHTMLTLPINALTKEPTNTVTNSEVKQYIDNYDQRRQTKFTDIFPELAEWYKTL